MNNASIDDRKRYLEVLAHLLVADFQLTEDESAFLDDVAKRLALSPDDVSDALGRVDIGADVGQVAAALPASLHTTLLNDLEQAAVCDGELAAREQAVLDAVRAALG